MKDLLTIDQSTRLTVLEKQISKGKKAFLEVGCALAEIRDTKLYKRDFETFEDYCRERWGWKKAYCYQLIGAAAVVKSLPEKSAIADKLTTETQARELAKVEPDIS